MQNQTSFSRQFSLSPPSGGTLQGPNYPVPAGARVQLLVYNGGGAVGIQVALNGDAKNAPFVTMISSTPIVEISVQNLSEIFAYANGNATPQVVLLIIVSYSVGRQPGSSVSAGGGVYGGGEHGFGRGGGGGQN